MRYTMFLYEDEAEHNDPSPEEMGEMLAAYGAYVEELRAAGVFVDTDWLQPTPTATVISLKDGAERVQDGPYADTKEQLGGYFVIDVLDLDAALAWARKCPAAQSGYIEVRPSAMPEENQDRHG